MKETIVHIFLFFGVGVSLLSALGIVVMRGMYDRLHYLSPMTTVGAGALTVAVVLREGMSAVTLKTILLCLLMMASSAVLTQATARAAAIRGERRGGEEG